jgi:hypothetical protein
MVSKQEKNYIIGKMMQKQHEIYIKRLKIQDLLPAGSRNYQISPRFSYKVNSSALQCELIRRLCSI